METNKAINLIRSLCFNNSVLCTVGYPIKALPDLFATSTRATEEEVSKRVDGYVNMLKQSANICQNEKVIYNALLLFVSYVKINEKKRNI